MRTSPRACSKIVVAHAELRRWLIGAFGLDVFASLHPADSLGSGCAGRLARRGLLLLRLGLRRPRDPRNVLTLFCFLIGLLVNLIIYQVC